MRIYMFILTNLGLEKELKKMRIDYMWDLDTYKVTYFLKNPIYVYTYQHHNYMGGSHHRTKSIESVQCISVERTKIGIGWLLNAIKNERGSDKQYIPIKKWKTIDEYNGYKYSKEKDCGVSYLKSLVKKLNKKED